MTIGVGKHRTELEYPKDMPTLSHALVTKKDWAAIL
jgi:hypothetical protein